jgi:hypothetical protein
MSFRNEDGTWLIDQLPQMFPADAQAGQTGQQQKKTAGPLGPLGPPKP